MAYIEDFLKEEKRKMCIPGVETDIIVDFCKNLEHKENFICSGAEYKGINGCVVFHDMRQFTEALNMLVNNLYKMAEKGVTNQWVA